MIRPLFTFASAFSLLLCVATAVMWVDCKCLGWPQITGSIELPRNKKLSVEWHHELTLSLETSFPTPAKYFGENLSTDPPLVAWLASRQSSDDNCGNFRWGTTRLLEIYASSAIGIKDKGVIHWVTLSAWCIPAAFAILPASWMFTRRRVIPGFCTICGYDLRASKDRCPECGTPIPAMSEAAA
jgi:hypothetical protein